MTKTDTLKKIQRFFDQSSINRDKRMESSPIGKYEQDVRQEGICEMLNAQTGDVLLDVGCGNARDISLFSKTVKECVGLDSSKGMLLEGIKKPDVFHIKSIHFILCDATMLPLSNAFFDKIICSEVIEHISNYEDCIEEMVRVLKKNGRLVITTPNKQSLYGLTRKCIEASVSFVAKISKIKRKHGHPYDEWKTQSEVITALSQQGINVDIKLSLCFIPSQIIDYFPQRIKMLTVHIVMLFEKHIRYKLNHLGYTIGLSGTKQKR